MRPAQAAECVSSIVGTDSTRAQDADNIDLGGVGGETFAARDTLIRSISVWQGTTTDSYLVHANLLVTRTLPSGYPDISGNGVLSEKSLVVDTAVPRIQCVFDPPLRLPGPGQYAFLFHGDCGVAAPEIKLNLDDDVYPEGRWVYSPPSWHICGCCLLQPSWGYAAQGDLLFEIEFCKESATPVRPTTLGRLKAIYR
jgi:hypothetical protein